MRTRKQKIWWVLVADGAEASFFHLDRGARRLDPVMTRQHSESRLKTSELVSDRAGRSQESSHTGTRHAIQPPVDLHRLEKRHFAVELAHELEAAAGARRFDHLVLVAEPRMLGELRAALPEQVTALVEQEIGKELTRLEPAELEARLVQLLWPEQG